MCGDSDTFYTDIENTLLQLRQAAGVDPDAARQWLDQQKSSGSYVIDIWA